MKKEKAKSKKINYFTTLAAVLIIAMAIFFLQKSKANAQVNLDNNRQIINTQANELKNLLKYPKAPDFTGIEKWINSEPLKIGQLKEKVVLVDFWTYTCINCIRTLPYIKEWDKKYRDDGLVIIGVHAPEFEFEKKYENVLNAVNEYQIKYPVAQDNSHATWLAYQNRYWPHKFLIDIGGYIRYDHIGEGNYGETEKIIQSLLNERMERLNKKNGINESLAKQSETTEFHKIGTPEIYFGYQFDNGNLGYDKIPPDSIVDYTIPKSPYKNYAYLRGRWKYNADSLELAGDEGDILLIFDAKKVNIVAGSDNRSNAFVFLDSDYMNEKTKGADVHFKDGKSLVDIGEYKLYNVASAEDYGTHMVELQVAGKGFKIYTFTFG